MRQPKFRGFSLETNSWHYGHGWFVVDYTDEYLKEKGINQQAMLYTDGYPVECELSSMGQYTGVDTKEDVELYEGDIVKGRLRQQECNFTATIVFEDGMFKLKFDQAYGNICYEDMTYYNAINLEVIGSTYK